MTKPEQDVVLAKLGIIQRCLSRMRAITRSDPDTLDDLLIQEAFILNLQRAIQAAVDLANHLIAVNKLGVPGTLRESFILLHSAGLLPLGLKDKMMAMVGFRNIAVHQYEDIKPEILRTILAEGLGDLESYCSAMACAARGQ